MNDESDEGDGSVVGLRGPRDDWHTGRHRIIQASSRVGSAMMSGLYPKEVDALFDDSRSRSRVLIARLSNTEPRWRHVAGEKLGQAADALEKLHQGWMYAQSETSPKDSTTVDVLQVALSSFEHAVDEVLRDVVSIVALHEIVTLTEENQKVAAGAAERIKAILNEITEKQRDTMVAVQASHFGTESKAHDGRALRWLGGVAAIGIGIIGLAVWSMLVASAELHNAPAPTPPTYLIVGVLGSKAVVLAMLYYAFVIAVKNYRAHRNLAEAYKQKANALGTFATFVEAARDDVPTRNAVLLAATSAIFSNVPTGYSADQPDPSAGPAVDLARTIKGGS